MRIEPIFIIDGPGRGNRELAANFENDVDAADESVVSPKRLRDRSIVLKPSVLEAGGQDRRTECQTSPGIGGAEAGMSGRERTP